MQTSGQQHLAMIESLTVLLMNGNSVKVTEIDSSTTRRFEETKTALKREDRVEWALRFYEKALTEQLFRMTRILSSAGRKPQLFKKKFGSFPSANQNSLQRQLQELADVDITLFQYETGPDAARCLGDRVLYEINKHIGYFLQVADTYGKNDPDNFINRLEFDKQPFGEIIFHFSRCEIELKSDIYEKKSDRACEDDLCCRINVEGEDHDGLGCTGALVVAFYDAAFSGYPTEKEFLADMKSGEIKRNFIVKIKPMFPIELEIRNCIDQYTRFRNLGED